VTMHWMDGGITPERPIELGPNEHFPGEEGNGTLFIGTKGKMYASTYSDGATLLPMARTKEVTVPQKYSRVRLKGIGKDNAPIDLSGADAHYAQWVEGCIAGYGKTELSSSFDKAGPLTEALLMANLAVRGHDLKGGQITYEWDNSAMKVSNFDAVNKYIKREYREGFVLKG